MAEDDPTKSGASRSSDNSADSVEGHAAAPAKLADAEAEPGFPAAGYPPPLAAPPYASQPGWWQASGASQPPGFGQAPGFRQPPNPGPGWFVAQPGPWGVPLPYPPAAWGFQPGFGPGPYAPPGPEPGLVWGEIGARFWALVIDAVVIFGALFALGTVATALTNSTTGESSHGVTAVSLIWMLFALIYHPACWYVFGATLGQKALGLRVAQAYNGGPLGIGGVLVRYLIFSVVTVVFPLGIVSAVMAADDPFKRAWHDEVARSVVVRRV